MTIARIAVRLAGRTPAGALALLGMLACGGTALAATKVDVMAMVSDEAVRNGRVPPALALAVAKVESDFDDRLVSSAGARGVMQIMPATALDEFGVPRERLLEPRTNIMLGIAYLERLYNQYGRDWELALSHYNGGNLHSRDGRFVAHEYTRGYVATVMRWQQTYQHEGIVVAFDSRRDPPRVPVAARHGEQRLPVAERSWTVLAEPAWHEIRRTVLADAEPSFSEAFTRSIGELGSRFRARLGTSPEMREESTGDQPRVSIEARPHRSATPAGSGRFNHQPYSDQNFL